MPKRKKSSTKSKKKPTKLLEPVITPAQPLDEPAITKSKKGRFGDRELKPFVPDKAPDDIAERSLVIVESPAKSKTIGKILGDKFFVTSCYGHVRDLPGKKFGLNIEDNFKADYEIIPRQTRNVAQLKKLARLAKTVYIASDPDREGEAIAWHLTNALALPDAKTWRVSFDEITAEAVRAAFTQPRKISIDKVNAQQTRRFLDRIVGYKLSPLLWKKIARGLSAGRVQSVAVKLIVTREKEINNFNPQEYWKFTGTFTPPAKLSDSFEASLVRLEDNRLVSPTDDSNGIWIASGTESAKLVEALKTSRFTVAAVTEKESKQTPPPPFITSTLQQQAVNQLGFMTKKTMFIAQQLYEGVELPGGPVGLITYMRTDSVRLSEQALGQCRSFITNKYGPEYVTPEPRRYKSAKSAQEAHEAIRPTYVDKTPTDIREFLTPDQYKLYNIIWKRFVATQMSPARWKATSAEILATMPSAIELEIIRVVSLPASPQAVPLIGERGHENETTAPAKLVVGTARFTASARKLLFNGYLALYTPEETALPMIKEQDELKLVNLTPTQSFTQPPPRYTEASLVKALEKFGIGRPSTYAPIISTIQSRGYVRRPRRSRQLFATELGILVTDKLQKFFEDVMDTGFTAQMEENLDKVEEAQTDWLKLLKDFYGIFSKDLAYAEGAMEKEKGAFADDGAKCEKCGSPMIIRWSRHGRFLACSAFPKCRTIKSLKPPASQTIDQPPFGEAHHTQPPPLEPPFGDAHLTTENNSTEDTESTETTE